MALATLRLPPTTDQDAAYSIGANYGVGVLDRGLTFGDHEAGVCVCPSACLSILAVTHGVLVRQIRAQSGPRAHCDQ